MSEVAILVLLFAIAVVLMALVGSHYRFATERHWPRAMQTSKSENGKAKGSRLGLPTPVGTPPAKSRATARSEESAVNE